MNDLIDILCIFCGAYLVYAAIVMKTQGHIIGNVLLKKGADESSLKDKDGFINFLFTKVLVVGILWIIGGIINFVNSYAGGPTAVTTIVCAFFAVSLIVYGILTNVAMRKFMKE